MNINTEMSHQNAIKTVFLTWFNMAIKYANLKNVHVIENTALETKSTV